MSRADDMLPQRCQLDHIEHPAVRLLAAVRLSHFIDGARDTHVRRGFRGVIRQVVIGVRMRGRRIGGRVDVLFVIEHAAKEHDGERREMRGTALDGNEGVTHWFRPLQRKATLLGHGSQATDGLELTSLRFK